MKPACRAAVLLLIVASLLLPGGAARADGPADNIAEQVRPVPPPGNEIAAADRATLEAGVAALGTEIDALRTQLATKPDLLALLPDVQIYFNAVRYPLKYHELIDVKKAQAALATGGERAKALRGGNAPWRLQSGPRGYVSKIDGSVQPFLLAVPSGYEVRGDRKYRIDFSCHGRGENLTELNFITGNAGSGGAEKFVCSLYGRYCCANKFAGEVDLLETFDALKKQYRLDENRVLIIGFSMGGAACWQFAVHYTDLWAAAAPGAGFAETQDFLKVFQKEAVAPAWYEQVLWHLYDCTDYAINLANCPTIAYAGEIDPQKQASDMMEKAMAKEGLKLDRIIGPNTKHAYEKNAKAELDKRLDAILAKGRNPWPDRVQFTTWTLRYNRMYWLTVDGLEHHWRRTRASAERVDNTIAIATENVSAMTIAIPAGSSGPPPTFSIDGQTLAAAGTSFPPSESFVKRDGKWSLAGAARASLDAPLAKRHGLQGPIDDAFMDSFLIVRPTAKPLNIAVGQWADGECDHAIAHWQKQFRGEARVKRDDEVTDADIAGANLICFGDPSSNLVLRRIIDRLPVKWDVNTVGIGGQQAFPADHHAAVMIYPNPLNPARYVVLNSGFTFREYDYLNNARQVPKLPDYAVIDTAVPVTPRAPGRVVAAGFFGERWEPLPQGGRN